MSFKNKNILVTGAGQGIGEAVCKHLIGLGANVFAVSLSRSQSEALKADCEKLGGGKITTFELDLTSSWDDIKKKLQSEVKVPLDGLLNNAGVTFNTLFQDVTEKDFDTTFKINVKGVFVVTQTLLPLLKDGSSIVNISSLAAIRSFHEHSVYSASKAAIDSLTKTLALELGPRKIRVNAVNPTAVMTAMGRAVWTDPKKAEPLLNRIPLHRFGEVEEVVKAVTYLLGEDSSYVNGHHLLLEGGYSVQ